MSLFKSSSLVLLVLSSSLNLTTAASKNGTAEAKVGWISGDNTRSSFDVIWSCLAAILVCTYKVIHLNIPGEETSWLRWRRRFKWMGWMALSPEILLSMAMRDWLYARESVRGFAGLASRRPSQPQSDLEKVPTGTVIRKEDAKVRSTSGTANLAMTSCPSLQPSPVLWTLVHAYYAEMGGYVMNFHETHPPVPLFGDQIRVLVEEYSLDIPYITKEDINDRSNADAFTKAYAIVQSGWLIINCIARTAQGLPITELELATMGFVAYALAMYLLWWQKPFEVEKSTNIYCPSNVQDRVIARMREMFEQRYTSKFLAPSWDMLLQEQRVRNWAYMDDLGLGRATWLICTTSILLVGMAFSGLHLAAWNWEFPTYVEQWLWRSAALTATIAPGPVAILLPMMGFGAKWWQKYTVLVFIYPLCGAYLICRTILMVQVVICFRAMPASVYKDIQWTFLLPHTS